MVTNYGNFLPLSSGVLESKGSVLFAPQKMEMHYRKNTSELSQNAPELSQY